ncbi:MAG TPA: tetratricopeptide repeat protein, partial [Actinospica sp.]|nr:tetratricopeptide repeat protein [Actinospica sp.]
PWAGGHGARFNLPPDTSAFTGRERELAELYEFEDAARRLGSGAAAVVAIDGMAGIGKTALALHAAHRMAERFPDGRMFLDLRGHSPGLTPLDPAAALDYFLRCLGVPPQLIPPDPQARSAFYRDRLTGTRTLIVLDNALGDAQVRPLLPPDPGCLVLVTSRRRLLGLDDAYTLGLDPFAASEAVELLRRVAGPEPLAAAAPDVAGELAELCGHMPLALRIAGSRLRGRRAAGLDELVLRLRDESSRLARLHDSDRSLISVFESSYAVLGEDEQLLLRRLGLAPGPEFDAYAAAALLDSDLGAAGSLLESLVDHNLVMQQAAGRYRLHDLVRFFAQRCAGADDAPSNVAALARLFDYYQQAAWQADARIARYQAPGSQHTGEVGTTSPALPELIDQPSAIAWMRDERANLLAARDLAAARGEDARVTALAGACAAYLQQEGPWPLAEALQESAAQAAVRAGDPAARAAALAALGRLRRVAGDYPSASGLLEQALLIYQGMDDELGEANARCDLGLVHYLTNDRKPAIAEFEEALAYYRSSGDLRGEGAALQGLGRVRQAVGEYALAAPLHERAAEVYAVLGDRIGEANALWDLARVDYAYGECARAVRRLELAQEIHRASGDRLGEANVLCDLCRVLGTQGTYPEAVAAGAASVEVFRALGNRVGEANALVALGRVRILLCEHEAAREALTRALRIFRDLDDRFGESQALHALGAVGRALGDHAGATDLLRQAEAISWATGDQHSTANIELELGRVCHATADFDEAAEHFALAVAGFRAVGDPQGEAEALNSTAALVYDVDGPRSAQECFQQALKCARAAHSPVDEAAAEAGIARCRAAARGTATGPDDLP